MSHAPTRFTRLKPWHYAMLAVMALALFLPGFFTIPPFDRDESRYAQASRQMLETGDFVDIRFQDEPRHKKPVGIYWMQAASVSVLTGGADHGPIWMYRMPSLLGAVAAVLLTAWMASRLFGATAGLVAGLAIATSVVLGVEARMAKTDAMLLATVVAAQGALARLYLDRDKPIPPSLWLSLLFWAALGVGILVKGPIILMVTGGTFLALWLLERRSGDWRWDEWGRALRPVIGVPVLLAIVLPWLVAIGIATDGAFFSYAIGHEFLGKAHTGQEQHGAPPGYFLLTFWLAAWPWSFLAVLALPWAWRWRNDPEVRFCLAWILPTWLIFEIVVTKLPHYTLVVFPAIAALAAAAALDRAEGLAARSAAWFWPAGLVSVLIGLAFAGAVAYAPIYFGLGPQPPAIAAAIVIALTTLTLPVLERLREPNRLLAVMGVGAVAAYGLVHGWVLPRLDPMWLSPQVQAAVDRFRPCPGTVLAAAGYTEPSMVLLVGTNTRLGAPEMVADHLAADPACALGLTAAEVGKPAGETEDGQFRAAMNAKGLEPRVLAELPGFNYSRGDRVVLRLYRLAPSPQTP